MRFPTIFIPHGMPGMALDPEPAGRLLATPPRQWEHPRAIVCLSAHLEGTQALVSAPALPETRHDCGGFFKALHAMRYPPPGEPAL